MPRNNDDNNKRTNYSSKNDNKKSVQSDKNNQYDLIDINVKKAQDDIKKIFDSAKSELNNFHKEQEKLVKNTVDSTQKQYKDMFSNVAKDYKNAMNSINSTDNFSSGRNNNVNSGDSDVAKAADKLSESVDKKNKDDKENISASKRVLNVFTNSVKDVLTQWSNRFFSGMNRIVDTYEATYKRVSVITNTNQKNYQDWQNRVSKDLQDQGLANNVTVSQAMEEMSSITDRGITDFGKASEMSMQNIVNKVIAPYVDTTTSAYTDLQMKFGENFTNNISGMGSYLQNIAGSNRVFSKSIDDVIDKLEPVQLWADKQLMSGEDYARVEALVASGQMTEKQALELVSQAAEVKENPYEALTNGTTAQKIAVANGSYLGGVGDIIGSMGNTSALSGSDNAIMQGAAGTALGTLSWTGSYSDVNKIAEGLNAEIEDYGKTSEDYYKEMLDNFKNDQYNTAEELRANLAENASTWLATFKEEYPEWYTFLGSMAKGISGILGILMADKFLGGSGGSGILSGAKGMLSKAGNAVGSGLMNVGLASGYTGNSIAGAIGSGLASTAGATAVIGGGAALGVNGISNVVSDFQNDNINAGTALSGVQGAAGLTAAGAGLVAGGSAIAGGAGLAGGIAAAATNPIGWIALAIGGIALLGKTAYDSANSYKAAGENVEKEFNNVKSSLQDEIDEREDYLLAIKDNLQDEDTVEQARQKLIGSGLLTEEEVNEAREGNKDALEKLTNKYLESTDKLSEDAEKLLDKYEDADKENANKSMKSIKDWYDKNKNVKSDENYDMMYDMVEAVMEEDNLSKLSEKDQEFAKKQWSKIQEKEREGTLKQSDLEWFLDRGTNGHLFYDTVEGEDLEKFTRRNSELGIEKYSDIDASKISEYILPLQELLSNEDATREQAETALKNAKNAGMERSKYSEIEDIMNRFGISEYATGTDYIPYDNYPALLHKGEAVVTSSGADILRGAGASSMGATGITSAIGNLFNIVATPIKEILGASSSSLGTNGNSSSKEIVDAIYYQTSVLESAIKNINSNTSSESINNSQNKANVLTMRTNYNSNLINLTPSMS